MEIREHPYSRKPQPALPRATLPQTPHFSDSFAVPPPHSHAPRLKTVPHTLPLRPTPAPLVPTTPHSSRLRVGPHSPTPPSCHLRRASGVSAKTSLCRLLAALKNRAARSSAPASCKAHHSVQTKPLPAYKTAK